MQLLNELVELAESAQKQGTEWQYKRLQGEHSIITKGSYKKIGGMNSWIGVATDIPDGGIAKFIAAANPAAILAIAEYVKGLEARADAFNAEARSLANHIPDAGKMIFPDNVPCAGSPDFVWLQVGCDSGEPSVWPERAWDNVTWNDERIHSDDVLYVNASLIGKPSPPTE